MSKRNDDPRRLGLRGAAAAALLFTAIGAAPRVPRPELHMRLEVALLLGGEGIVVALIR